MTTTPETYSEEEKEKLLSKANMGAPSILAGSTSRKDVSKEMMAVAGGIGILAAAPLFAPVAIIGGATGAWLLKTIFDKKIGEVSHGRIRKEKEKERDEIPIG